MVTYNVQQLAFALPADGPEIRPKFLRCIVLRESTLLARKLHSVLSPLAPGAIDRGAVLWNLTGDNATSKPGRTLLPVLTVLFLVSYGLLTMLVVEQGRTIDSQRNLIRLLFDDSVQLSSLKGKANQKRQAEAQAQAQMKAPPAQATPRDPRATPPSAPPRAGAKNQSTSKLGKPLPQKPPKDTSDQEDERRMLISI
jgi:hypothetical protein